MASVPIDSDNSSLQLVSDRFDYYAATVNSSVDRLRGVLSDSIAGEWEPISGARHGFHYAEGLRGLDGNIAVRMLHGGNGDLPHVYASGDDTDAFVPIIRREFPDRHKVSRLDAAFDFDSGPGTWDRLYGLHLGVAMGERVDGDTRKRASKVRTGQMGDWVHAEKGRTFYLGSRKSAVLVRLYEKGVQLREIAGSTHKHEVSPDLVRMECQVRPDGPAKLKAATATPREVFGYSEWSRELFRRVDGSDVERVHIRERRDSDHERALNWMAQQYENHLVQLAADLGGWEAIGQDIRRRIELGHGTPVEPDQQPF